MIFRIAATWCGPDSVARTIEVVMDEVIGSVDVSNCNKVKFQVSGSCLSVA